MSRTRRDTGFKPKPKAFHTTSGVGTNVSFRLSGNGSIADPFIVQKSLAADTVSFGKVQLVNDVYLIRKVVFGTTTDLGGSKSLMANLSNSPATLTLRKTILSSISHSIQTLGDHFKTTLQ